MPIPFNKNHEITSVLITPEYKATKKYQDFQNHLEVSAQQEFEKAFNVPDKITVAEYLALDLDINRRRTSQCNGFMYLRCYECKEGYCFDRQKVIDGVYGCEDCHTIANWSPYEKL